MKLLRFLLFFLVVWVPSPLLGEYETEPPPSRKRFSPENQEGKLLKTRRIIKGKAKKKRSRRTGKTAHYGAGAEPRDAEDYWRFSVLAHTPLLKEIGIHRRFTAYGLDGLVAIPLVEMDTWGHLYLETGLGLSLARGSIPLVTPTFTDIFIHVPLRARLVFSGTRSLQLELVAGLRQRLFEFDSRPGTNGGFFFLSDIFGNMDPDLGVGVNWAISETLALRLVVSYLALSVGLGF